MQTKRVPMRMCVGCSEMKPKKELIRIVRDKDGNIVADFTGKIAGRGAYICPDTACLAKARKSCRIDRTFGQTVSAEIYDSIEEALRNGNK